MNDQYGPIRAYYADLTSGGIAPEDLRIESLPYRATIDAVGQVTGETPTRQVISRYNFVLRKIYGWIANPLLQGFAPSAAFFNPKEEGRSFDIFKVPQPLAPYLPVGGAGVMDWDGVYIAVPGTQLAVNWTVNVADWINLVGGAATVGVNLSGDYVNCGQPPAPKGG